LITLIDQVELNLKGYLAESFEIPSSIKKKSKEDL